MTQRRPIYVSEDTSNDVNDSTYDDVATNDSPDPLQAGEHELVDQDTVGKLRHRPDLVLMRMTSSTSTSPGQGHRRLSDPGCRLSVHSLRDELRRLAADNSDESTACSEGGRFSSINRIPDPRLDLIRSLTPSITSDAAGEEGEALNPVIYRSSRRRSTSYQLEPPQRGGDTRRLCLLGTTCAINASFSMGVGAEIKTGVGEAVGAISMLKSVGEAEGVRHHHPTLKMIYHRRRSASLEGGSHLDVILEEKNGKEKFGRKLSLPVDKT